MAFWSVFSDLQEIAIITCLTVCVTICELSLVLVTDGTNHGAHYILNTCGLNIMIFKRHYIYNEAVYTK